MSSPCPPSGPHDVTTAKRRKARMSLARHDHAHCLAPGLFRSLRRGERDKTKLNVTYRYGCATVRFVGFEPLGVDDLRVLQGLVAMAGAHGSALPVTPRHETDRQLRRRLEPRWDAVHEEGIVVRSSFRALAAEIGYANDGGKILADLRARIERLWAVSIIVERDGRKRGFRLLSEYGSNERTGHLHVALSPLIAQAVACGARHVRIDMTEVRNLKTDPARLLHQRLCGWVDHGKTRRVGMNKLCDYIWPNDPPSKEAGKKRRQTVRKALSELSGIGWKVRECEKEQWEINRPRLNIPSS